MIRFLVVFLPFLLDFLHANEIPPEVRSACSLDPWYQKYVSVEAFPIVGSARVSSNALAEAAWIVRHMLNDRTDILTAMTKNKVFLTVMAHDEYTTDVPEHSRLTPKVYWDRRARGLGATLENPCVSCAEENLLAMPGDPYATENIMIHEFAHAIHGTGLISVDLTFEPRLEKSFASAIARGLWKGTYAGTNKEEYWAEAVQCWFDDNRENDALHNHVNTRIELREYDLGVAGLCEEVFGDKPWRYLRPLKRAAADRAHLVDWDPSTAPTFQWREAPIPDRPLVRIQTEMGDIELELDTKAAPMTVKNFLTIVGKGYYSDGRFFRTLTAANQADDAIKINVIQAQSDPKRASSLPPTIALERTRDTGLRHLAGTISMAREADPDTGGDHFFICVEDQPALDFGGRRNPDGQGFAAFGKIIKGMEIVKLIHAEPADGQTLRKPVLIQRAIRLN